MTRFRQSLNRKSARGVKESWLGRIEGIAKGQKRGLRYMMLDPGGSACFTETL